MFNENKKIQKINDKIIKNDLCRSIGYELDYNWRMYFQIFLTNSKNDNYNEEEFNTYNILLFDEKGDNLIETYNTGDFSFNTIEEILGFIFSNKLNKQGK